jgi:glycosyltransferase involved in cell wall biosynthesis
VDVAARVARVAGIPLRIGAKLSEPQEWNYFESRVAPLLGPDVEFVGEVKGRDKYELLGNATCLLNPISWSEPFGTVMIEALACGTPIVATARGAAPEIVDDGQTGYLCDIGDLNGLRRALANVSLLDRRSCRRVAEQRFSADRMASEHVELYRSAMGAMGAMGAISANGPDDAIDGVRRGSLVRAEGQWASPGA